MAKKTKKMPKPRDPGVVAMVQRNGKGAHGVKSNKTLRRADKMSLKKDYHHKDMRSAA